MKVSNPYGRHSMLPKKALLSLEAKIIKKATQKESINISTFSNELHKIGDQFIRRSELESLNKHGKRFAENLVNLGRNNLAGIIYSLLIRVNPKHSTIVEQIATNALTIAKRFNDPIHIMARANDLKEIYKITDPGSKKHIDILQTEKRALTEICTNYEGVKKRYKSVCREMRPLKSYELKLAAIKFEVAEILQKENKPEAIKELEGAYKIINKHGSGRLSNEIDRLLGELKK